MSSALVRQALSFVESEENSDNKKRNRRTEVSWRTTSLGQDKFNPYIIQNKINKRNKSQKAQNNAEDNIRKLLQLSKPISNSKVSEKILERAVKGKPLLEKVETKQKEEKSILFPEESFKSFEKTYFCS